MNDTSSVWKRLAKLPQPTKAKVKYDRAKRSKAQLIRLAESMGLTIEFDYYKTHNHAIMDANKNTINWDYYPNDWLSNLYYIEQCLEDYAEQNNL
ncbi:hypothetical protein [uncultured Mediterranean phage]|nr:hypothetical protein [uncultured Mediterranean phage]